MTEMPPIIRTVEELRTQIAVWRKSEHTVGLVPTMGALHKGHLSLVSEIAAQTDKVIVSIFVNPTQFGENDDLDKYPRHESEDQQKLAQTPAALIFAPTVKTMYPDGHCSSLSVSGISEILEGAARPGHFDGVATIVSKLLLQSMPDIAIFGEKDYQQLAVIRQFVRDLDIPVEIMGGKLVREKDGLAYSSRNAYLSPAERQIAAKFNQVLRDTVSAVRTGKNLRIAEKEAGAALIAAGFLGVDYVTIVDKATLRPVNTTANGAQLLAVARIGGVRLLDNMVIEAP